MLQRDLVRENTLRKCRKDLRVFLYLMWQFLCLPNPTKLQYEMAEYLQNGPKRKQIRGFRGIAKSWITSALVIWKLLCNPEEKVLVLSASKRRADDFASFTKRVIDTWDLLRHLRPKDSQRYSNVAFDVGPAKPAQSPSVTSMGITGQMTGSRASVVVADDVEVPGNSMTQDMREKLIKRLTEFEALLIPPYVDPNGILRESEIVYLGTPQSEESVYDKLLDKGFHCRQWPARVPQKDKLDVYKGFLAPSVQQLFDLGKHGDPTEPTRFTDSDLMEREAGYGKSGFMLQFMLDTALADQERYPLKLRDLVVMDVDPTQAPLRLAWSSLRDLEIKTLPNVGFTGDRFFSPISVDKEWKSYDGAVLVIDPSGRGQDETGFCVAKILMEHIWVPEFGGLRGGYEVQTLEELAKLAMKHKVNEIVVESNFGDGMYTVLLRQVVDRIYPCTVTEIKSKGQKELRIIDTLEPVLNSHRLVIDKKSIERDIGLNHQTNETEGLKRSCMYQLSHLTRDRQSLRHDDRLDALSMAVSYWKERLNINPQREIDELKVTRDLAEIQKFTDSVKLFGVHAPIGSEGDSRRRSEDVWMTTPRKRLG